MKIILKFLNNNKVYCSQKLHIDFYIIDDH